MGYGICLFHTAIVQFLGLVFAMDQCKAVDRPCRDCAVIVLSLQPCTEIKRILHGALAASVRRPRKDCTMAV